jgi:hypothetical protein
MRTEHDYYSELGIIIVNSLSVIEHPKSGRGKHYGEWLGASQASFFA